MALGITSIFVEKRPILCVTEKNTKKQSLKWFGDLRIGSRQNSQFGDSQTTSGFIPIWGPTYAPDEESRVSILIVCSKAGIEMGVRGNDNCIKRSNHRFRRHPNLCHGWHSRPQQAKNYMYAKGPISGRTAGNVNTHVQHHYPRPPDNARRTHRA